MPPSTASSLMTNLSCNSNSNTPEIVKGSSSNSKNKTKIDTPKGCPIGSNAPSSTMQPTSSISSQAVSSPKLLNRQSNQLASSTPTTPTTINPAKISHNRLANLKATLTHSNSQQSMSDNRIVTELAELIRRHLSNEAQFSKTLSHSAKDLLATASSLVEQAYKLDSNPAITKLNQSPSHSSRKSHLHLLHQRLSHGESQDNDFSTSQTLQSGSTNPIGSTSTAQSGTDIAASNITSGPSTAGQPLPSTSASVNNSKNTSNPQAQSGDDCLLNQGQHNQQQNEQQTETDNQRSSGKKKSSKRHNHLPISQLPMQTRKKLSHFMPRSHSHRSNDPNVSSAVNQKNFKQRLIALIKKFRTDGSDFNSEEQYREALKRELIKAAAGRGSRAIEELFEEELDVEEESGSELEGWDNISDSSTPKPSLRPFFSSTTLDKI